MVLTSAPLVIHVYPHDRLSYAARWNRLGLTLNGLTSTIKEVKAEVLNPQVVQVEVGGTVSVRPTRTAPLLTLFETKMVYTIYGSKDVSIAVKVVSLYDRQGTEPLHLPR